MRLDRRRIALFLAAEVTMIVLGAAAIVWFGADIVVQALRLALIGMDT